MKRLILLILIAVIFVACDTIIEPENTIKIRIVPEDTTVGFSYSIDSGLTIENATDLFAISGELYYNSEILQIRENQFEVSNCWGDDALLFTLVEENCLSFCISLSQADEVEAITGDKSLISFKIKGIYPGESDILLQNIHLIDEDGNDLDEDNKIKLINTTINVD